MTKSSPLPSSVNKLPDGTLEITFTLPWVDVHRAYDQAVTDAVAEAVVPGFRKGKAPRDLVEPKLDKNHTLTHALQHLLPKTYAQAIEKHQLKPVLYPSLKVQKGQEGQDWTFIATTCEAPQVKLGPLTKDIAQLVKSSQVQIADLLVESEANHRLSGLAENLNQLGLSIDKYLATKKITAEQLKAETARAARHDLTVEFILQKIQVDHKLADRQKTLDFLANLV